MGIEYTFYDYIDADGGGANVVKEWLNGTGKPAKAYFTNLISNLEASKPPGFKGSFWCLPYARRLRGEWSGFWEIRKTGRVQFRLLLRIEGRSVFLVGHAIHKGQNYEESVSPRTASMRVTRMMRHPATYGREHEY